MPPTPPPIPPEFSHPLSEFARRWWANSEASPEETIAEFTPSRRRDRDELLRHLSELRSRLNKELGDLTDEFVKAWAAVRRPGPAPRIEQFLQRVCRPDDPSTKRPRIFYDLLVCEIRARFRRGETPTVGEYRARFSDLHSEIARAFDYCNGPFSWRFHVRGTKPLARGGQGEVFLGHDDQLDRPVLVKRVKDGATDEDKNRLWREAQTLARLTNPGVPAVYAVGHDERKRLCLAEHLIRGPAPAGRPGARPLAPKLARLIEQFHTGPRPQPRRRNRDFLDLVAKLIAVCRTVAAAHRHPFVILHCDLNPRNIVVDADGQPFVIDWGLAIWLNRSAVQLTCGEPVAEDMTITAPGGGTAGYLSPEQARRLMYGPDQDADGNEVRLTPAADVFGLGSCLFQLLTNHRVYDCKTPWYALRRTCVRRVTGTAKEQRDELMQRACAYSRAPNPRAVNPRIDRELADIARRALARNPDDRYPSASELAEALEDWIRDNPPRHRCGSWFRRRRTGFARWVRRNTGRFVLVTLVAVLGLVVGAAVWVQDVYQRRVNAQAKYDRLTDYVGVVESTHTPGLAVSRQPEQIAEARKRLQDYVAAADGSRSILDRLDGTSFARETAEARLRVAALCHAKGYFDEAVAILEDGVRDLEPRTDLRERLAQMYFKLGDIKSDRQDYAQAITYYTKAEMAWLQVPTARAELARTYGYRGDSYVKQAVARPPSEDNLASSDFALAEKDYDNSLKLREEVLKEQPNQPDALAALAHAYNNFARLDRFRKMRLPSESRVELQTILDRNRKAASLQLRVIQAREEQQPPDRTAIQTARTEYANTLQDIGEALLLYKQYEAAEWVFLMAWTRHSTVHRENPQIGTSLALAKAQIGRLESRLARTKAGTDDPLIRHLVTSTQAIFDKFREFKVDGQYFQEAETKFHKLLPPSPTQR